jgi:hypothetical protein
LRYPDPGRPQIVDFKRRDAGAVDQARLEIALAISNGVLRISITVAKPTT